MATTTRGMIYGTKEEVLKGEHLGKHDFWGALIPSPEQAKYCSSSTFSVGVFKWVQCKASGGKWPKASKAILRVIGRVTERNDVIHAATRLCKMLDEGWEPGQRSFQVPLNESAIAAGVWTK